MNLKHLLTLAGLCLCASLSGQIKIGDNPQNLDATSVLELESNDRVLVITRISEAQMNSLVPLQGAMVYNTDAQCIFYYDGANWINLCDSLGLNFTTDPIVNSASTIVITENGDDVNFEVGEISSENILDFSINSNDIQNNSITADKLAPDSVGSEELQDNTVTDAEIDYNLVTLNDFINDAGYITAANIVSGNANNAITDNGGAFYDDSQLISDVAANTAAIAADGDTNATNELQSLSINADQLSITGGNTVTIPTGDGSDTNIQGGTNINVTGIGTGGNPYVINNTFAEVDGSISNELQDLQFNTGTNILTLTNPATPGNQVNLSSLAGGGGSTELADQITIVGTGALGDEFEVGDGSIGSIKIIDGTIMPVDLANNSVETAKILDANVTPIKIEPSAINNQFLTTIANAVVWADLPPSGGSALFDPVTISGTGVLGDEYTLADNAVSTIKILDNNVTPAKIEEGAAGQVLTTDGAGVVVWATATAGAVSTDGVTVQGDGTVGNEIQVVDGGINTLQLANDAVTTLKILDNNVTPDKLEEGTVGQVLTTDAAGDVIWAAATAGAVSTDGVTVQGDGTLGNEIQVVDGGINTLQLADDAVTTLKILDNNVTPDKLEEGAAGEVLTTDAAGDVIWAVATAGAVSTDGVTVQGDGTVGNEIQVVDGGINTLQLADDAVTTFKILDNNVTPDKLEEGAAGEVLTTDAAGDVIWAPGGAHLGTPNSIFFADDPSGAPTEDNAALYWDPNGRTFFGGSTGALYVGIDGNPQSDKTKVHIGEDLNTAVAYPLQLQNFGGGLNIGTSVGVLFSVDDADTFGKGALVYERNLTNSRGDFHFLQDQNTNADNPDLTDAVVTIKNSGDMGIGTIAPAEKLHIAGNMQLDGNLIAQNGAGNLNEVLTITAAGTEWAPAGAGGANLSNTNLQQSGATNRTYDINGGNIAFIGNGNFGIGSSANPPSNKLHVAGAIRSEGGILNSDGNANEPAYRFNSDTNMGMFRASPDQLAFSTGSIEALRIVANQNIGIGTPAPSAKLHVAGNLRVNLEFIDSSGNPGTAGQILSSTVGGTDWIDPPSGGTVNVDGSTISGDGFGTPLFVTNNGIDTGQLANEAVTPAKIEPGADGEVLKTVAGAVTWTEPAVVAMGKVNGGSGLKVNGATISSGGIGIKTVTLSNPRPAMDGNYIIQLAVFGDNRIYVTNQGAGAFTVEIRENNFNALIDAVWYFTVLDF